MRDAAAKLAEVGDIGRRLLHESTRDSFGQALIRLEQATAKWGRCYEAYAVKDIQCSLESA